MIIVYGQCNLTTIFFCCFQASQALNLCAATIEFSGSTEQAEGERLLLLASKYFAV